MKCPKCKKQLRKNAKFCPGCGARVEKKGGIRFTSILLVVAILLGIVAIGLGSGVLIAKYFGGNFQDLLSRKETIEIHNVEEAIAHAKELGEEYGYENALSELTEKVTTTIDGDSYYRLQQNYQGIPVYGKTIVYATNEASQVTAITGNVIDVDTGTNTVPSVSEELVFATLQSCLEEYIDSFDLDMLDISLDEDKMCIFFSDLSNQPHLAYRICTGVYEFVIDAHSGQVLYSEMMIRSSTYTGDLQGQEKKHTDVHGYLEDGTYYLIDVDRQIGVGNVTNKLAWHGDGYFIQLWDSQNAVNWVSGEQPEPGAVDAYVNAIVSYDYFENKFSLKGPDGKGKLSLCVYTGVKWAYSNGEPKDYRKNAAASIISNEQGEPINAVIYIGDGVTPTFSANLDVVAHEYTHNVEKMHSGMFYNGESGAIMEALSDIFGELIESWHTQTAPDWMHGISRNIASPEETGDSTSYGDGIWVDKIWDKFDNDGVHRNSTVISHAAYLMWNGIDGNEHNKIDTDSLAKLWYRAMLMMPSDCDFRECRQLVELAATSMELTTDQLACISEAFDTVGIKGTSQSDDSRLVLFTTSGKTAVKGTVYEIKTVDGIEKSLPISAATVAVYSHNSNKVCEELDMADADGFFEVALSAGSYSVSVSADGYIGETITFELEENEVRYLSIALEPQNNETENDFGAYNTYLSAANKTIESGSWSEYLIMIADMAITDGSAKTKTKVTLTSDADVSNYSESNLSQIRMSGSAEMTVMGQTYAWNMEYENGTAHYRYTKPNQTSADMKIDPSFFSFGTMTSDMMTNAKVSGNKITFTVPGEKIAEVGIAAVNQMSGVDDLKYGDVDVTVMISAEGTIDTITMIFHASMKYQGYDANVDYDINYSFFQSSTRPNSNSISETRLTQVNIYENGNLYAEDHYSYNEEGLISEIIRNYATDDGYGHTMLTTELQYDSEQRLVYRVYYNDNSGTASFVSYNYDSEGKLTDYYNKTGINYTATCEYDSNGRLIKETRTYPTGEPTILEYEYDNQNHLIEIKQTEESGVSYVNFFYDSNGRLSKSTYGWTYGEQYEYEYCYDYKFFEIITSLYFEKYTSANILDVMGHEIYGYAFTSPEYTADSDGYLVKVTDNAENRIYEFQYSN